MTGVAGHYFTEIEFFWKMCQFVNVCKDFESRTTQAKGEKILFLTKNSTNFKNGGARWQQTRSKTLIKDGKKQITFMGSVSSLLTSDSIKILVSGWVTCGM